MGTPDANGAAAKLIGSIRLNVCVSPSCSPADVRIAASVTDVRCLPGEEACGAPNDVAGRDYTGELQAVVRLRLTDTLNGAALTDAATTADLPFRATVPCAVTGTSAGSTCAVNTSANAIAPGSVSSGRRAVWQLGQVEVYDGGTDGDAETAGNTVFLRQGVFAP